MTSISPTITVILLAIRMVQLTSAQRENVINNCCDLGNSPFTFSKTPKSSGLYVLSNFCGTHLKTDAYCDNFNGGGGWLVVQRRVRDAAYGYVNFNRSWVEYENGLGKLSGEFWYGLKALHCLTGQSGWEMRIDIKYKDGRAIFLHYKQFKVASAKDNYKLTVGSFLGEGRDPMAYHNNMSFTTVDRDNDILRRGNCAIDSHGPRQPGGGWWYRSCWAITPNHYYRNIQFGGIQFNFYSIEIKIRPVDCKSYCIAPTHCTLS